jgi:hypothetical protein
VTRGQDRAPRPAAMPLDVVRQVLVQQRKATAAIALGILDRQQISPTDLPSHAISIGAAMQRGTSRLRPLQKKIPNTPARRICTKVRSTQVHSGNSVPN